MSYEPLHHKYRPQTFKDLVGQEAIATTLISAISSEKIAPAYLFTGPRGTGKTSSARILAKSLNCLSYDKPTSIPCGKCEVCKAIATGNALDVIEIDAASNTGVDNIREIIERSRFAPVQSRYKVYAIDECHMLSTAAFNALLKTLEEPPSQVVFILATTDPQRVLSTIISRCQRFDYRRIRLDAMVNHLEYIARQENIAIDTEALTLIAQIANGGLRDAESLLDQLSLFPDEITVEQIWDLVGAVPEKDLLTLLTAIRKQDTEDIVVQCRNLLDRGREPLVLLQNLASFYLNLLIAKTSPNRQDLVAVTETCWQQLCTEAQYWQFETILQGQQQLKEGEVQIKNTTQPRLWLEVTLLSLLNVASSQSAVVSSKTVFHSSDASPQLATAQKKQSLENDSKVENYSASHSAVTNTTSTKTISKRESSQQVTSLSEKTSQIASESSPTVSKTEREVTTQQTTPVSITEQATIWQRVVDSIHPPMTQALLRQHCHLISLDSSAALVGISSVPLHKMHKGKVSNIETAFAKVCQRKIKVTLEVASNKATNKAQTAQPVESPVTTPPQPDKHQENKQAFLNEDRELTQKTIGAVKHNKQVQPKDSEAVSPSFATDKETAKTEEISAIVDISPDKIDRYDNFQKAVELVAQKFDGEVVELQNSSPKITITEETISTESSLQTSIESNINSSDIKRQKIVIKREAIADYDDDDIPFMRPVYSRNSIIGRELCDSWELEINQYWDGVKQFI